MIDKLRLDLINTDLTVDFVRIIMLLIYEIIKFQSPCGYRLEPVSINQSLNYPNPSALKESTQHKKIKLTNINSSITYSGKYK